MVPVFSQESATTAFIPKKCRLCFWHSTSEGDSPMHQGRSQRSGIKQSSTMSPGQLLHASPVICAAAKEFLFKRRHQPAHCPQQMGGDGACPRQQPWGHGPAGCCIPVLAHLGGDRVPLLVDRCWWTDFLPCPRLDSHKPKQAVIYQS